MKHFRIILALIFSLWTFPAAAESLMQVHVYEVPVRTVLEGLARSGRMNLIVDDTVQGNITVHLTGVTAAEAVRAIAASQNLFYDDSGPVRIITAGRKQDSAKTFHTWQLQYTSPQDIREAVRAVVPEADVRCHDETNMLIIGGTWQEAAAVGELVRKLDTLPQQVDVEVEIASVDRDALKHTGVDWEWSHVKGGSDHDKVFSFEAQIHALEEKGKARILAKPHMVAVNGKEARILIGDRIPVQTEHISEGERTATTEYQDAGIQLRYIPRIHADGSVTAYIQAEVSTPVFVPELKAYRIATRQAQSVVRMTQETALVIGGLIRREDIENFRKVPLLGDLPLLGRLFRSHYTSSKETEVVILLRAEVVGDKIPKIG